MRKEITAILLGFAIIVIAISLCALTVYVALKHIELTLILSALAIGMAFGAMFTIGLYSFIFNKEKSKL